MANSDIQKIKKILAKDLDSKRLEHTFGVAYTAACLAMRYDYDMDRAYLAGLLHDCAKCMTHDERLRYCKKYDIEITDIEKKNPSLLHAKVGAAMCRHQYGIMDEEICSAVRFHTTGRPDMTLLEKIIFIADYLEPNRDDAEDLPIVRRQVFCDLDETLCTILKDTLHYLDRSDKVIDPMTQKTYEYYVNQEH